MQRCIVEGCRLILTENIDFVDAMKRLLESAAVENVVNKLRGGEKFWQFLLHLLFLYTCRLEYRSDSILLEHYV